jgi:hypothetical protein
MVQTGNLGGRDAHHHKAYHRTGAVADASALSQNDSGDARHRFAWKLGKASD